mgnify:CR=1 FL=1
MGRKRIEARIKKEAVEAVKSGKLTQSEASKRLGVGRTSIQSWILKIESEGEAGLEKAEQNRVYSVQLKREAVESYLTGDYSLREICEMFKIRDKSQLQTWLKVYNSGGDFKRRTGGSRMKSTHKVTQEERIQVANGRVLGYFETRGILWQKVCFQARAYSDDSELHCLLQHPAGAAQFGYYDANGKTLAGIRCIKNCQETCSWQKKSCFFSLSS